MESDRKKSAPKDNIKNSPGDKKYPFLDELLNDWMGPRKYAAAYLVSKNPDEMESPGNIHHIFAFEEKHFSETARKSLDILETHSEFSSAWLELKWKFAAFIALQDLFPGPLYEGKDIHSLFRQWYFYFESKYLLMEMILCGLNGFAASLGAISRLFLEFSLLQNYFFRGLSRDFNYSILEQYFEDKYNPKWSKIVDGSLPADAFCKPIKRRLNLHLKGLSDSCVHPYQPNYSPKHLGVSIPEQSLEGLWFGHKISLIIDPVLWMYYVNFPMAFHPVNIQARFGFNYPVGMFIDDTGGKMIEHTLSQDDYNLFKEYSIGTEAYENNTNFFESQKVHSDAEIRATWNEKEYGPFENLLVGHCKQMSKLRVMRETMALKPKPTPSPLIDEFIENLPFGKWRKYYKTLGSATDKSKDHRHSVRL